MADRVASDHPSVPTLDGTVVSHGPTKRLAVELPGEAAVPSGEVLRLVVDGTVRFARPQSFAAGTLRLSGAFDAPEDARSPGDQPNRLREWLDRTELTTGRTVHVDVIDEGSIYGIRAPGDRVVYDAPSTPADSLASIARSIEDETDQ
jgi:hypothetical protein